MSCVVKFLYEWLRKILNIPIYVRTDLFINWRTINGRRNTDHPLLDLDRRREFFDFNIISSTRLFSLVWSSVVGNLTHWPLSESLVYDKCDYRLPLRWMIHFSPPTTRSIPYCPRSWNSVLLFEPSKFLGYSVIPISDCSSLTQFLSDLPVFGLVRSGTPITTFKT